MKENRKLSNRERNLVNRGYSLDDVEKLCNYTEEEINDIVKAIMARITLGCTKVSNPTCTFIGGQPGVGKSSASMRTKNNASNNGIVEIGIDNYRMYHPHYLKMEEVIRDHWKDRIETNNDTPGNDIADFTHSFAGEVTDLLIDRLAILDDNKGYNILFEWGMRTPEGPLNTMKDLKELGYTNIVNFVVVYKDISLEACRLRADVMNTGKHIVRRVPDSFHELCVNSLPDSCNEIYKKGYIDGNLIDNFMITTRDGSIVWNCNDNKTLPGEVLRAYLNNPNLSINYYNDKSIAKRSFEEESVGLGINKDIHKLKKLKDELVEIVVIKPDIVKKSSMNRH